MEGLGFQSVIKLIQKAKENEIELVLDQIEEYVQSEIEDNNILNEKKEASVDIQDTFEMFQKISLLLANTPFNANFISILQNMLLLAEDNKKGSYAWPTLELVVQKILLQKEGLIMIFLL